MISIEYIVYNKETYYLKKGQNNIIKHYIFVELFFNFTTNNPFIIYLN